MGGLIDQFLHFRLGFLVGLLPFGILQSVTDTRLMDVGDAGAKESRSAGLTRPPGI